MNNSAAAEIYSPDLEAIVVGETAISDVQGEQGTLSYRGIDIASLATEPFNRVLWLVVFGHWPTATQEAELEAFLAAQRPLGKTDLAMLKAMPRGLHPMLMLQGMLPLLDVQGLDTAPFDDYDAAMGLALAARMPTLIAAWHRLEQGLEPLPPSPQLSHHENFLVMFNGVAPSAEQVALLDTTQILQLEHSFNAGTFAGRVCTSTLSPIQSALSASVGTLFGRLHGGADQAALEMAQDIGTPEQAADYVSDYLRDGVKIMGMGHREYRVVDPRARILKPLAQAHCDQPDAARLLAVLVAVEEACQREFAARGKDIHANVEFYKGAVFYSLGIPPRYFTALFAMARVFGYVAHFLEFRGHIKLIRPRARYLAAAV